VNDSVRNPFQEHVGRVLLLVDGYTTPTAGLRGWDSVARTDFLLRYPTVLAEVLHQRGAEMPARLAATETEQLAAAGLPLRFKFGPWEAAYYPVVGHLVSTRLVQRSWTGPRVELRSTSKGRQTAEQLEQEGWAIQRARAQLLGRKVRLFSHALTDEIEMALANAEDFEVRA
jgi:hypothetical protein